LEVSDLDPAAAGVLLEHTSRLKHDLGKYIALQQRWLGPDAPEAEREIALRADLLETRRGPSGSVDAATVWQGFRPWFVGDGQVDGAFVADLSADPDVSALIDGMERVTHICERLRNGPVGGEVIERGCQAAVDVSKAVASLHRRVRDRSRCNDG